MEIIKCMPEHLDDVAAFYDRITKYLEENINYPKWTYGDYPGRVSVTASIAEGSQYACIDGGKVIGAFVLNDDPQADYSVGDWRVPLNKGEFMVIHALATDYDIYHKGLGRQMVEFCIETAKRNKYKAIRLDAVPTNTPARRLYESMGFLFAGERDLKRGIEYIPLFALYELNF